MRWNTLSLDHKLKLIILGTLLMALVLSQTMNVFTVVHAYRQEFSHRMEGTARLVAAASVAALDFNDPAAARENLASLRMMSEISGAAIYDQNGKLFSAIGTPPKNHETMGTTMTMTNCEVCSPILSAEEKNGTLVIRGSLAGQWDILTTDAVFSMATLVLIFALSGFVGSLLRRRMLAPLKEITTVVTDIGQSQDYSRRVHHQSNDEIGTLVNEFNAMLDEIGKRDNWLQSHREMLEDIVRHRTRMLREKKQELQEKNTQLHIEMREREKAEMIREEVERLNRHDLKSSLTLVIGYPEILLGTEGLTPEQRRYIKRIEAAGYRMLDMVRNHLDMFKMEKGIYTLRNNRLDMVELLCGLEEEFVPLLRSSQVTLNMSMDGKDITGMEEFSIQGEDPLIRAMVRNLIQNAVEASGKGDTVYVYLRNGTRKRLTIQNTGMVPKDIQPRFFEKYATHGKEHGTGLGTYFAALVARTHQAGIAMKTDAARGTRITVTFKG